MRIRYILIPLFAFLLAFSASADELGQEVTFNIDTGFDINADKTVRATLRALSDNAYFYVSDEYTESFTTNDLLILNNKLDNLGKEFEDNVYPKLTGFWGNERKPGVDNDDRITILLTNLVTYAGGYFDTGNSFSKKQIERSNERDMLYVNTSSLDNPDKIHEFLSHELQHLISLNHKELNQGFSDDVWLNELRSEYSVTIAGYNDVYIGSNLQRRVVNFSEDPSDSLTEWTNTSKDYAQAAVFGEYVVDKYGKQLLLDSVRSNLTGIASIPDFEQIFKNWMVANFLNDKSLNNLYGYDRLELVNFKVKPTKIVSVVGGSSVLLQANIKDWQSNWFEVRNPNKSPLKIDYSGPEGEKFGMPYIAYWNDGRRTVGEINMDSNSKTFYVQDIDKIILMPFKKTKITAFSDNESTASFNLVIRQVAQVPDGTEVIGIVQTGVTPSSNEEIVEGSLIRLRGGEDIYVIRGEWKRFLLPETIKQYGHLDPNRAIEVDIRTFNSYKTSNYVRYINDERVYAVWPNGTKHWFNMTGDYFLSSHRSFDAIFIINELELNSYQTGVDITR